MWAKKYILIFSMIGIGALFLSMLIYPPPFSGNAPFTGENFGLREIELQISSNDLWKLKIQRDEALQFGVLMHDKKDWVKAGLREGELTLPIELRLKGDWIDHLKDDKWSFRIRTQQNKAWNGLKVFSIQDPSTRNYLWEWAFHLMLRKEGVLSTRYDFLRLNLNGKYAGVYAIEEHFTDELLQAHGRIIAPILHFDETGVWETRKREIETKTALVQDLPLMQAAEILPFSSREENTQKYKGWVEDARILLNQFRFGYRAPNEYMDLVAFAKHVAVCDLFSTYHSMFWQNRRYYYNPVSARIEPIVFDGFQGAENQKKEFSFAALNRKHPVTDSLLPQESEDRFWIEPEFLHAYFATLEKICAPIAVSFFLDSIQSDADIRLKMLRSESPFISGSFQDLILHASKITSVLKSVPSKISVSQKENEQTLITNQSEIPIEIVSAESNSIILWPGNAIQISKFIWAGIPGKFNSSLP